VLRGSKYDLPVALEGAGVVSRQVEWGDLSVALETFAAGTDPSALFKGLPDDRCQCPHWGYVVRGRFRVRYGGREEIVTAGDAYHIPPGHVSIYEEDTEVVEFSPKREYQTMLEAVAGNWAAVEAARAAG
jgi:Cupin domain